MRNTCKEKGGSLKESDEFGEVHVPPDNDLVASWLGDSFGSSFRGAFMH